MAKKAQKRRSQTRVPASRSTATVAAAVAPSRPAAAAAERPVVPRAVDLANEYRYVYGDLKRIGLLALGMFALLIVLALAAQYVF